MAFEKKNQRITLEKKEILANPYVASRPTAKQLTTEPFPECMPFNYQPEDKLKKNKTIKRPINFTP